MVEIGVVARHYFPLSVEDAGGAQYSPFGEFANQPIIGRQHLPPAVVEQWSL
jgi:hypothetical protein